MNNNTSTFIYSGWDAAGHAVCAQLQAEHLQLAKDQLCQQGIIIKKIRKAWLNVRPFLTARDLVVLLQQLAQLVQASVPIIVCLQMVAQQFKPKQRSIFYQLIALIEQGESLSQALAHFPIIFPHYFIQMISIGEESGQLALVLQQLAEYQTKTLAQQQQIKTALLYPLCVFIVSVLITLGLLLFIVPQFQLLFATTTSALPQLTRLIFSLSDFLQHPGPSVYAMLIALGLMFTQILKNNFCRWRLRASLSYLPGLGPWLHACEEARYLYSLGLSLRAGLPLLQALALAEQVMAKLYFGQKIKCLGAYVQSGMSLQQAFLETRQFSAPIVQLVAIGEQTSQLPRLLLSGALMLEERVHLLQQRWTHLLQPLLICVLGILLGSIIIGLYSPLFKLGALY
ncbi:MAG TPA: type II secretion system F family protein [Gammaproteobacteria bacterium]|nr:type II secretion system F family protein [Gammaproteobacteria bacterium]